jgi:hypothetical protein
VWPDDLDFCASTFYGRIEKPPDKLMSLGNMVSPCDPVASSDIVMKCISLSPSKMNVHPDIGTLLDCSSSAEPLLLGAPASFNVMPPDIPAVGVHGLLVWLDAQVYGRII